MTLIHNWKVACEKISLGHGNSFLIFSFYVYYLYFIWWEVFSKLVILDFLMKNEFSWEDYFQNNVLFKIGIVLLLRNFFIWKDFLKLWENLVSFFIKSLEDSFFKVSNFEIFKDLSFYIKERFSYFKIFIKLDIPYKHKYFNLVNK